MSQPYVVQSGDTLSSIAQQIYGDASRWQAIYQANREVIGDNPDLIQAGATLNLPAADLATVSGTVGYLQRIALLPDASITVRLEDVSRADVAADVLAEAAFSAAGQQPPFPFELFYDPARIVENGRYNVRGEIRDADGALRFASTSSNPVITNGAPTTVDLILDMI